MDVINILYALGTIIIGTALVKITGKYINKIKNTKSFKELSDKSGYNEAVILYVSYFIKLGIYLIISLIAISFLGFAEQILTLIAIIITLSIIAVLVYSVRDLIPSAFAGSYLMRNKYVKKGDVIKIKDYEGKVEEINLLTTTIKDEKGGHVIIPNKIILEKILKKK